MADPLSVAAGVVGSLTAAAQISSLLIRFTKSTKDAPARARYVLTEVSSVSGILAELQSFILGIEYADRSRTSLIQVDHVIAVLSGCVLTFSELQKLLEELKVESMDVLDRVRWFAQEKDVLALVQDLQNHKISLSLMLNVLSGNTIVEAKNSIDRLYDLVSNHHQAMSSRLLGVESQEREQDCVQSPTIAEADTPHSDAVSVAAATPLKDTNYSSIAAVALETFDFSQELLESQVYRRALEKRNSAFSSDLCTLTWSYLSGVSLADISNISVINLAVTKQEAYIDPASIDHIRDNKDAWPSAQSIPDNARNQAIQQLKNRVRDWHGLNLDSCGQLQLSTFAVVSATKEQMTWSECWLFKNTIVCVTREQTWETTNMGVVDSSKPNSELQASIFLKKHLLRVEARVMTGSMMGYGLTLHLSAPRLTRVRMLFFSQIAADLFTSCLRHYYPYAFPIDDPQPQGLELRVLKIPTVHFGSNCSLLRDPGTANM